MRLPGVRKHCLCVGEGCPLISAEGNVICCVPIINENLTQPIFWVVVSRQIIPIQEDILGPALLCDNFYLCNSTSYLPQLSTWLVFSGY